jgi:hypothetical protein
MNQRILRLVRSVSASTIYMVLGLVVIGLFFGLIYLLANDEEFMPGLARTGNLNFDFNAGELIFGVLGGGAAVWAAKTFARWSRRDGSPPQSTAPQPRRPTAGGDEPEAAKSGDDPLDEINAKLARIQRQLDEVLGSRRERAPRR